MTSLSSLSRNVKKQIFLEELAKHEWLDNWEQPAWPRVSHNLTSLIVFYDEVTSSTDKGRELDGIYLEFSKIFGTVSHSTCTAKLERHDWITGLHPSCISTCGSQPLMLAMLCIMQPKRQVALFATGMLLTHGQVFSTRTPRSFSQLLLSSGVTPSIYWYIGLFLPRCRTSSC